MGLFDWLLKILTGAAERPSESVDDVADRLDRCGDRFRNANDAKGQQEAREAAWAARKCGSLEAALKIEREFMSSHGLLHQPAPSQQVKPQVRPGSGPRGTPFISWGNHMRFGGSRGWRNNNPGFIRWGNHAQRYGAIGSDGPYAIFPNSYMGIQALLQWLRQHDTTQTLGDVLPQMLPADDVGDQAQDRIQQETGLDPNQPVKDLTEDQLKTIVDACQAEADRTAGEIYEQGKPAPSWVDRWWEEPIDVEPADAQPAPAHESALGRHSDNS